MYSQPSFYKFSEDSILLAKFCAEKFKSKKHISVLDLCSGCGVVGIEFCLEHENVDRVCFVEEQNEFNHHLLENIKKLTFDIKSEIYIKSLQNFDFPQRFDVIICNPPFFIEGTGRSSSDPRKNKCHFFSEEMLDLLLIVAKNSLAKEGEFYFLGRKDQKSIQYYMNHRVISEVKNIGKSSIFSIHN